MKKLLATSILALFLTTQIFAATVTDGRVDQLKKTPNGYKTVITYYITSRKGEKIPQQKTFLISSKDYEGLNVGDIVDFEYENPKTLGYPKITDVFN